jgi:predicted ATP-grasp superfamily ATP-dependent carboligase
LVYEFVTGGGFVESPEFPPILCEAYAMLNSLVKDFSLNAGCETFTVLDRRILEEASPADASVISKVSSSIELDKAFKSALSEVDGALIVAPETNGILSRLTAIVEDTDGICLLGSSSKAIECTSNKENTIAIAKSMGITVPETVSTSTDEGENSVYSQAQDIGFPVVIKPTEGAGCEGVFVINSRQDLAKSLKILGAEKTRRSLLIQEYVKGTDASVSILSSSGGSPVALSLNRQIIELRSPNNHASTYEGGYTPFDHALKSKAFECARKVVSAVPGLKGYVGVDLVLTEDNPVFIEVNARITTSYTGLYRVLRVQGRKGTANAIINAVMNNDLPSHVEVKGCAYYAKSHLKPDIAINKEMIDVLSNLEYVESPPVTEQGRGKDVFLVSEGNSLNEALEAKSRNERKLDKIARRFMAPSPRE